MQQLLMQHVAGTASKIAFETERYNGCSLIMLEESLKYFYLNLNI